MVDAAFKVLTVDGLLMWSRGYNELAGGIGGPLYLHLPAIALPA